MQEHEQSAKGEWTVDGVVVHGAKLGRLLGFPTANIALDPNTNIPFGVYAVRVLVNGRVENGVACYGTRPQFDNGAPMLEVHILDFDEDIYGEHIFVDLVAFQRHETTFADVQALMDQMSCDCDDARNVLSAESCKDQIDALNMRESVTVTPAY